MKHFMTFLLIASLTLSQHTLSGTLNSDGQSVAKAQLRLKHTFFTSGSDQEGKFKFNKIDAGTYTLIISHVGFEDYQQEIKIDRDINLDIELKANTFIDQTVTVKANRASIDEPMAFKQLHKEDIAQINTAKDLPLLIDMTPSVTSNSDAGNGVGYSSMRIRGTDITRINVMLNGIPLNDSESQGVFWVNMPDLSSSIHSIQIQRGVGTSTHGAGAFGASVNILTDARNDDMHIEFNNSYGSYATLKHSLIFSSGLFEDNFSVDLRLSQINSNGYIERASSDLRSMFLNLAYYDESSSLKLVALKGKEKTYQAWNGVPIETLNTNRTFNLYTYENETDNYWQDHYQLIYNRQFGDDLQVNLVANLTEGEGYFEQYIAGENLFDEYELRPNQTGGLQIADVIRQRWLDNSYSVITTNAIYTQSDYELTGGIFYGRYEGDHFGDVIGLVNLNTNIRQDIKHRYYFNDAIKQDFNAFAQINYQFSDKLDIFADLQFRSVSYEFESELDQSRGKDQLSFFNPKFGLSYQLEDNQNIYASVSIANKEPSREDYVNTTVANRPKHEELLDFELGYRWNTSRSSLTLNSYYMTYTNQLALSGQLNDVGASIRVNLASSHRLGLEIDGQYQVNKNLSVSGNATISQNKVDAFTELIDDFDSGNQQAVQHQDTDISFSPNFLANLSLSYQFLENVWVRWDHKFVGSQFLDNTSNTSRQLGAYTIDNLQFDYQFSTEFTEQIQIKFQINNVLNEAYVTNGWIYPFFSGGSLIQLQNHFPQALRNYMLAVNISI